MDDDDIKEYVKAMKDYMETIKNDPIKLRQLLVDAGIIDESGQLAEYYRS